MKSWLFVLLLVVVGWANLTAGGETSPEVAGQEVHDTPPETEPEPTTPKTEPTEKISTEAPVAVPEEPVPEVEPENGSVTIQCTTVAIVTSIAASLMFY